jgi:hypothetical protein
MAWEHRIEGPIRASVTVRVVQPARQPQRIAVSRSAAFVAGGICFLDFSRPIRIHRRFGRINRHVGLVVSLIVPVIHQGEELGDYVISVDRSDPCFEDLCALWTAHYPALARNL